MSILNQFNRRLLVVERDLTKLAAAPTFPIYDIEPQDMIEGQVWIGADDSLNWYSDGSSFSQPDGIVNIGSIPQDVVEGQIVLTADNGLAWYSRGSWHGGPGTEVTGNPPQDAINGQIVCGNAGILCWFKDGVWYTFGVSGSGGDWILGIEGVTDLDSQQKCLYYEFAPQTDLWLSLTLREDAYSLLHSGTFISQTFTALLAFTEWIQDQAYYGGWWLSGGFMLWTESTSRLPVAAAWNLTADSGPSSGFRGSLPYDNGDGAEVYDMHILYQGLTGGSSGRQSQWFVEVYHNNIKRYDQTILVSSPPGKVPYTSISAIVIPNHYADNPDIYVDDISVGTLQGGHDLLPVQTFNDATYGDFAIDLGSDGQPMLDSFWLFLAPDAFNGHTVRTISGAPGSYNDDNNSETVTGDFIGNGIFYEWVAPSDGTITFRTDNSDSSSPPDIGDTKLYAFDNTLDIPTNSNIAFNDDDHAPSYGGDPYYSLITFTVIAGQTYYILVNGYNNSTTGTYKLSWSY